ncbi:MAG: hypothetical protein LBU90_10335 [Bacteroidales bacterium]|jgi:predicted ATP-dependent serine protease|nr:hypothetical protein [Bacteroidales bacterium]
MAFFTNNNIVTTKHETLPFSGKWHDSFGCPPVSGSWILYGSSGSGKTSFALQLAKYLTNYERVLYWSIEQGNSKTFQKAWKRENMQECGSNIIVADGDTGFEMIIKTMTQRKGRNILIVDSLTPLRYFNEFKNGVHSIKSFGVAEYIKFCKRMKGKLIIWISHEKQGLPDTTVGDYIMKLADLKMRCEGYKVMTNSRAGESMKDFIVWERGAREYKGI